MKLFEQELVKFSTDHFEENKFKEDELIRLYPHGLSLSAEPSRPMLIFKDKNQEHTLPVSISPLEAGVALAQFNQKGMAISPHKVTKTLLESLQVKIEKCIFVEIKGMHQFVRLYFSGHPQYGSLKFQADEAISLCLYLDVEIYATKQVMEKSRRLSFDLEKLGQGASINPVVHPALLANLHEYIQ